MNRFLYSIIIFATFESELKPAELDPARRTTYPQGS